MRWQEKSVLSEELACVPAQTRSSTGNTTEPSALAGWCREHGLFEHQLAQWREEFCTPAVPALREASIAFRDLQRQQ